MNQQYLSSWKWQCVTRTQPVCSRTRKNLNTKILQKVSTLNRVARLSWRQGHLLISNVLLNCSVDGALEIPWWHKTGRWCHSSITTEAFSLHVTEALWILFCLFFCFLSQSHYGAFNTAVFLIRSWHSLLMNKLTGALTVVGMCLQTVKGWTDRLWLRCYNEQPVFVYLLRRWHRSTWVMLTWFWTLVELLQSTFNEGCGCTSVHEGRGDTSWIEELIRVDWGVVVVGWAALTNEPQWWTRSG